jgi:hypothetical protein
MNPKECEMPFSNEGDREKHLRDMSGEWYLLRLYVADSTPNSVRVRVTSTLVKLLPPPEVKIVGNLCEKAKYGWRWE